MLARAVFVREMAFLEERFNREHTDQVLARYYDTLSARLTTEEFAAAARYVFDHDSFWPPPARFIELAQGNPKEDATREWVALVDACSRGDRDALLSPAGEAGMRAAGGWAAIAYAEGEYALSARQRAFTAAYLLAREDTERGIALPDPRKELES